MPITKTTVRKRCDEKTVVSRTHSLARTMGSSPSKDKRREAPNRSDNKKQQKPESKLPLSSDNESLLTEFDRHFDHTHLEEKKEMETVSAMSATPRAKHKYKDYEAQSRVDRLVKEGRDDVQRRSRISDEQVHVNLAMADLMAYLQVVANNSNNLPLTRRDDPELGRMVSTLTSEEYARKSAAFIPADVRVIGGSFTKYGRVWDLPTSEEYNAQDGAQEPGKFRFSFDPRNVLDQISLTHSGYFDRAFVWWCM